MILSIACALLAGWFLNLFGFAALVSKGIVQLGGPEIGIAGYYLIFAAAGFLKNVFGRINFNINSD